MNEFELIAAHFAQLAAARPGAFGLGDDAATVSVPPGCEVVSTADALVAGVHFRRRESPATVAARALRTNLSDLAAMGAAPHGYMLALAMPPDLDEAWVAAFAAQLARDQTAFDVGLLGGDTVATPGPLTVAVTALGFVRAGRLLRRTGARPGDSLFVSGTIGDAALALKTADADPALWQRFRQPEPRLALGQALAGVATAAIDVSDGLVADVAHLCRASKVAARLDAASVPLSPAARRRIDAEPALIETALTGGDDYELAFTLPPGRRAALSSLPTPVSLIGSIEAGEGVVVHGPAGKELTFASDGWRHF